MSMSYEEMRELRDSGELDDTVFEKQEANSWRKKGWKIMGAGADYTPYVVQRGFETREDAIACIQDNGLEGVWVKEASEEDHDFYSSGEKGYWASMTDEEFEFYSECSERGVLFD